MLSKLRPTPSIVVSMVALFVALGGSAYALSNGFVGTDGLIRGCVKPTTGVLVLIKQGKTCPSGTQAISWISKAPIHVQTADSATNAANATNAATATNALKLGGAAASSYAKTGSDAFTAATLNDGAGGTHCNWTNYENGQQDAGYFRDAFGIVHLKGFVVVHEGSTNEHCGDLSADLEIFSLPPGYRPDLQWAEQAISNNQPARININQYGVEIEGGYPSWDNAKVYVSLEGLTYRCAPSGVNGCP